MSLRVSPRKGRKGLGGAWSKLSTKSQASSTSSTRTFSPFVSVHATAGGGNDGRNGDSKHNEFESSYYSHPFRQTSNDASKAKKRLNQFQVERTQQQQQQQQELRQTHHSERISSRQTPPKSLPTGQSSRQRRSLQSPTFSSTSSTPPRRKSPIETTSTPRLELNTPWENDFVGSSQPLTSTSVTPPSPPKQTASTAIANSSKVRTPIKPLKPLLKPSKRGLPSSSAPSANPWMSSQPIPPFRPPHGNDGDDDDNDTVWRKDGQTYRSQLVQLDDDNGGRQFVINKEENLVNYFEIAHRVSVVLWNNVTMWTCSVSLDLYPITKFIFIDRSEINFTPQRRNVPPLHTIIHHSKHRWKKLISWECVY